VRAFAAGADALIMPPVARPRSRLAECHEIRAHLARATRRFRCAGFCRPEARVGLEENRLVDVTPSTRKLACGVAERGAGHFGSRPSRFSVIRASLPLDATSQRARCCLPFTPIRNLPGRRFGARSCACRFDSLTTLRADTKLSKADSSELPPPDSYDVAILGFLCASAIAREMSTCLRNRPRGRTTFKTGKPVATVGLGQAPT